MKRLLFRHLLSVLFILFFYPLIAQSQILNCHSDIEQDCIETCPPTTFKGPLRVGMFPMEEFFGTNVLRQDPVDKMAAVGFIREYHNWVIDEGNIFNPNGPASPPYPNQEFRFNFHPQFQTYERFDKFYDDINALGLEICADMEGSLPRYALKGDKDGLERVPVQFPTGGGNIPTGVLNPQSYLQHADYLTHFLLRYGNNPSAIPSNVSKLYPLETPERGRGNITYIENWNEQDKCWFSGDPNTYLPLATYGTLAWTGFDGAGGAVTGEYIDPTTGQSTTYSLGASNFGVKYVFGGLASLDWNYVLGVRDFFSGVGATFPFDVLNFHHYSDFYPESVNATLNPNGAVTNLSCGSWASGVKCPEQGDLKLQLEDIVTKMQAEGWDKELWLSEFGYGTKGGTMGVPTSLNGGNVELTQAQWNARAFLETAAAGFDRGIQYNLVDVEVAPGYVPQWQGHGLITEGHAPKTSWYFTYTMKNILEGTSYAGQLLCEASVDGYEYDGGCGGATPRIYKFSKGGCPDGLIWAIWNPSDCDFGQCGDNGKFLKFPLECGGDAEITYLVHGSIHGMTAPLEAFNENGQWYVYVPYTETPVFVKEKIGDETITCPDLMQVTEVNCTTAKIEWSSFKDCDDVPVDVESYIVFAGLQSLITDPQNPNTGDLTFLGNFNGSDNSVFITGLQPNTDYYIYVVPQSERGFPVDCTNGCLQWCYVPLSTNGESCELEISPAMICSTNGVLGSGMNELFDDQFYFGANYLCSTNQPSQPFLNGLGGSTIVDLGKNYKLNLIHLFDMNGEGDFVIEYANIDCNSSNQSQLCPPDVNSAQWKPLVSYYTTKYLEWHSIVNLGNVQPIEGVRFLRFTKGSAAANIGEVVLCGEEVSASGTTPCPPEPTHSATCTSLEISWPPVREDCDDPNSQLILSPSNYIIELVDVTDPANPGQWGMFPVQFDPASGNFVTTILNMPSCHTFEYIVKVFNGCFVFAESQLQTAEIFPNSCEDCDGDPPGPVDKFFFSEAKCRELTVNWEKVHEDENDSTSDLVDDYHIYIYDYDPTNSIDPDLPLPPAFIDEAIDDYPDDPVEYNAPGLKACSNYYFVIEAFDDDGNCSRSQVYEVPTLCDGCEPCPVRSGLEYQVTCTTAKLVFEAFWEDCEYFQEGRIKDEAKYVITVNGAIWSDLEFRLSGDFFIVTVFGLEPNTTYTMCVQVTDKDDMNINPPLCTTLTTGEVGYDDCDECPCLAHALDPARIIDLAPHPATDPTFLVDEQWISGPNGSTVTSPHKNLNPECNGEVNIPGTEWGEIWPITELDDYIAAYEFIFPTDVWTISLFDGPEYDVNNFKVSVCWGSIPQNGNLSNLNCQAVITYQPTGTNPSWITFPVEEEDVDFLLIEKDHPHARIQEIAVCETKATDAFKQGVQISQGNETESKLSIMPNPSKDKAILTYKIGDDLAESIVITDITGKKVKELALKDNSGKIEVNTESLPSGTYYVILNSHVQKGVKVEKWLIIK